jgi:hypothetical protein
MLHSHDFQLVVRRDFGKPIRFVNQLIASSARRPQVIVPVDLNASVCVCSGGVDGSGGGDGGAAVVVVLVVVVACVWTDEWKENEGTQVQTS